VSIRGEKRKKEKKKKLPVKGEITKCLSAERAYTRLIRECVAADRQLPDN
jgi:hypothetical protein